MFRAGIGHSPLVDTADAVEAALDAALVGLDGAAPGAALLFCGDEYDPAVAVQHVQARLGAVPLIGCTSSGEFSHLVGHTTDAVLLALLAGAATRFSVGLGRGVSADPAGAARAALAQARAGLEGEPRVCITLPEGVGVNLSPAIDALADGLPGVPVLGGSSAAFTRDLHPTVQFFQDEVVRDALPVLLIGGAVAVSSGTASGWRPVGAEHRVTAAAGHVVAEIAGRPALELYQTRLGLARTATFFGEFPLAVLEDEPDAFYLRAPFQVEPESGAVTLGGSVQVGDRVRLAFADREQVLEGAREAMSLALDAWPHAAPPAVALAVSCAGRRWILGQRAAEESEALRARLAERWSQEVPLCGFFSGGEIAPTLAGARPRYHNETCVVLLLEGAE